MTKWEHGVLEFIKSGLRETSGSWQVFGSTSTQVGDLRTHVHELGLAGWEMAAVDSRGNEVSYFFKRAKA